MSYQAKQFWIYVAMIASMFIAAQLSQAGEYKLPYTSIEDGWVEVGHDSLYKQFKTEKGVDCVIAIRSGTISLSCDFTRDK